MNANEEELQANRCQRRISDAELQSRPLGWYDGIGFPSNGKENPTRLLHFLRGALDVSHSHYTTWGILRTLIRLVVPLTLHISSEIQPLVAG